MRPLKEIIVHCTATRPEWMAKNTTKEKVAEVTRWHTDPVDKGGRGWKAIGYHYLIDRDGTVAEGRPLDQVGAHTLGRNTGTIGVSLMGGFDSAATDKFEEHFTASQERALRSLISSLQRKYGYLAVSGHNQWAQKACPGFSAPNWFQKV